ncbi:hypothetical protein BKA61DRAFT_707214 [Leptodontidium sp. MPI-SDFR-AT-0119]|nr:hypothetical protein BKA61DRAFT_707214 [Leptodontidium sp. MPI-SDFR-AT-0119]
MQLHSVLLALASASACYATARYSWSPEKAASVDLVRFLFPQFESKIRSLTSWWASSYLTTSNGQQYFLITHVLGNQAAPSADLARASLLNVNSPSNSYLYYFRSIPNATLETNGVLDIDTGFFGFKGLSSDSISRQNAYFNTPQFSYNITWDTTATKPLLNAGGLPFLWGSGNTTQYSFPSCATVGTLTVGGTALTIDPANSFTWYDRQISYGGPVGNTTWWQLNFANGMKASIWAVDSGEPFPLTLRFATVRDRFGDQTVIPYTVTIDHAYDWVSSNSNKTYPQRWTLNFANGDHLYLKSVVGDQEIYGPGAAANTLYEGFITAEGSFMGQRSAFGVAEMAWL